MKMKMMLAMLVLAVFTVGGARADSTRTRFVCEFKEKEYDVRMEFVAIDLANTKKVHVEVTPACQKMMDEGGNTPQCPIKFSHRKTGTQKWITPKDSYSVLRAGVLNSGDSSDIYLGKEKSGAIVLAKSADDDCVSAVFGIFENSGFERGYYSARNNCDGEHNVFSEMTCKVSQE